MTSSTSPCTSTRRPPTSARGTSNGSYGCGRPRSATLRRTSLRYAGLTEREAVAEANRIWETVNGPNLEQNVAPTRGRATLVLRKAADHSVRFVRLRKL